MPRPKRIVALSATLLASSAALYFWLEEPADADFERTRQGAVADCIEHQGYDAWGAGDYIDTTGRSLRDYCEDAGWTIAHQEMK